MLEGRRTDGTMVKLCGNCKNTWREGDKYCRYCGAPLNNPTYKLREFYTMYGPLPVRRKHSCPDCGFVWTATLMSDNERYCPKCGAAVSIEKVK